MQEEKVDQADAAEEPTADTGDTEVAAAVDEQAAASDGSAAEAEPEVPNDASDTIARAQSHLNKLDMDSERAAAKKAT